MVAKGAIEIKGLWRSNSYFDLILCPAIGYNFPVVDSTAESDIGNYGPKNICLLFKKHTGIPITNYNSRAKCRSIPLEPITGLGGAHCAHLRWTWIGFWGTFGHWQELCEYLVHFLGVTEIGIERVYSAA